MCKLFIGANSELWQSSTRSMRVDGVVTSIRLENFFWQILEEVADKDTLSVGQLITSLYLESMDAQHDLGNFTSFLRVCCARYLSLASDGLLNRHEHTSLNGIDASNVLHHEQQQQAKRLHAMHMRKQATKTMH